MLEIVYDSRFKMKGVRIEEESREKKVILNVTYRRSRWTYIFPVDLRPPSIVALCGGDGDDTLGWGRDDMLVWRGVF